MPSSDSSGKVRHRLAALTPRERRFLAAGAITLILFALYLLWPSANSSGVEIAEAPPPATAPPVAPAPPPPPVMSPPPMAPAAPQADPGAVAGLILRGVMGGGPSGGAAIVAGADGAQRVVRVGRDLAPGLTLRQVGVNYAIASSAGGDIRLELNKPGGTPVAAAPGAPAATRAGGPSASASAQRETMELRLGLEPVKSNGRTSGYSIKPGAVPARLQRAGLKPGDVILRINGSELDEERLMELSWQLSNSERTEFEFVRNGQTMKAALQ
jgi:general secretion pathway protein C